MSYDYIGKIRLDGDETDILIASTLFGTCTTAGNESLKIVNCENFTELIDGVTIKVKFEYNNTASNPTININNTGVKPLYRYGTTYPGTTDAVAWYAGSVLSLTYYNDAWYIDSYKNDTWIANDLNKAGYVAAPTSLDGGKVWSTDATGHPYWKGEYLYILDTTDALYTAIDGAGWVSDVIVS